MTIFSLKNVLFATFMEEIFAERNFCGWGLSAKIFGFAGIHFCGSNENLISHESIFPDNFKIHLQNLVLDNQF